MNDIYLDIYNNLIKLTRNKMMRRSAIIRGAILTCIGVDIRLFRTAVEA